MTETEPPYSPAAAPGHAVPPGLVTALAETRPWVRLISVLGFVGVGITVLMLLFMMMSGRLPGGGVFAIVPMLLVPILYLPPATFLWRYADRIRHLEREGGITALEHALNSQKSFWKFVGILAVVGLIFYAVVVGGSIAVGLFGRLRQ